MPGMSGFDLHRHIADLGWNIPMILITAYANDAVQAFSLKPGIFGYLVKPFSDDDLFKCLSVACSGALGRGQAP
jgi:FixJ family two-component response regulator